MKPVVFVEWLDPTSVDAWDDVEEAKEIFPLMVRTVGFLIDETKDKITLALSHIEDNDTVSNFLVIPRHYVLTYISMVPTKEKRKKKDPVN